LLEQENICFFEATHKLQTCAPDGMDVWELNNKGEITNRIKDKTQDAFYMVDKNTDSNYQRTYTTDAEGNKTFNSITFEYGTIESQKTIALNSNELFDAPVRRSVIGVGCSAKFPNFVGLKGSPQFVVA
jgi:hypothetical protein